MTQIIPFSAGPARERFAPARRLRIGLVNNMPDAALEATERQFRRLLSVPGGEDGIDLRLFHLSEIPRGPAARDHLRTHYAGLDELMHDGVDALVVTGCEPRAAHLSEEPYWASLTTLVDWARTRTVSTLWSCLAAHAAVLHLDGIERRRLAEKAFGIFGCAAVGDHALLAGLEGEMEVPHSRLHALGEADLVRAGYDVLTRSAEIGVDAFVKRAPSLFVFLQGHPEYDGNSLAREFRRDLARSVSRPGPIPAMPRRYFDERTTAVLGPYLAKLARSRDPDLLRDMPEFALAPLRQAAWQEAAGRFYANWLALVGRAVCDDATSRRPRPRSALRQPRDDGRSPTRSCADAVARPAG